MIGHVVFWKLADTAEGRSKRENAQMIKQQLEALVGVIPGLLDAQVGINDNGGEYDAALISHFESREALAAYDVHPAHQKVRAFVRLVSCGRTAVDYQV